MAFGFNDFAKFFDPVSDLLGTSGKRGVGLLQQKPEDIAMTAAAIYLAANGIPVTPESVAAVETATATGTAEAAAAEAAAQEAARVAAQEATQQGILQAKQMNPELLNSINGPGMQTADAGGSFLDRFLTKGVELDPSKMPPDFQSLATEQQFTRDAAKASLNNVPPGLEAQINAQQIADYGTQPMRSGAFTDFSEPTEQQKLALLKAVLTIIKEFS
jgi:hypothetical protein